MATAQLATPASITEVPIPLASKSAVEAQTRQLAAQEPLAFDPKALKEKYLAERDRRLARNEGVEQYTLLDGQLARYLKDPWVEAGFERAAVHEETDVVIVGGGYGAQVVAVRLIEAGVKGIRIVEKAGDFGGTWYWNRYPGAQCDIESYIYMPLLEELGLMPSEKYAKAAELLEHSRMIGEKYDLYSKALFQTEVCEMRWNEDEGKWSTHTSRGDVIKSRFIIPAAGPLHRPKFPGIKGIEEFQGHTFHSSRWDFDYTGGDPSGNLHKLKDKRVGIIGTGATAVQIVPHLGEWAKHVYVFQRTPSSIDVRDNRPTDPAWAASLQPGWQQHRMDNFDSLVNGGNEPEDLVSDRWTDIIRSLLTAKGSTDDDDDATADPAALAAKIQLADFQKMESIRARCDAVVHDKQTADALKPWYNQFCKRPCFHDSYLQTFNRPNVTLVDTHGAGVSHLTPTGVVANTRHHELDCLIYATGFELANDWSHKTGIEIHGRDNLSITQKWADGASTLHGWTSRSFPNCLWVSIVQAALTPNFMHITAAQAAHFAYVISECKRRGIRTFEPTREAEEAWCETIVKGTAVRAEFFRECTPGYYNNEGRASARAARNATYGYGSQAFIRILEAWREEGGMAGLDVRFFAEGEGR